MKNRGFTIVELIVVVVVIAMLAALTIFSFGAWRQRAAETEVKNALIHAAAAMNDAKNFTGSYPAQLPSSFTAPAEVWIYNRGTADFLCLVGQSKSVTSVWFRYLSSEPGSPLPGNTCGFTA